MADHGTSEERQDLLLHGAGICIAFGLEFHELPTREGNVAYIIAEGGIGRNYQRVLALCAKYEDQLRNKFRIPKGGDYVAAAMNSGKFNLIDSPVDPAKSGSDEGSWRRCLARPACA